jgi:16S rRNA (cytosine967-C5)-methyltransferase
LPGGKALNFSDLFNSRREKFALGTSSGGWPMNPRLAAAKALAAVLSGKASLNSSLPTQLDKVEDRDRFTQDLAFGTARWQPRLSALAAKLLQKPFKAADADVEALLLVGLYQLLYTRVPAHAAIGETVGCADKLKKPWAKALLNAVLRRAQRESEALLAELERDPVVRTATRAGCKNP